jgi:hypothetical protein
MGECKLRIKEDCEKYLIDEFGLRNNLYRWIL